MVILIVSQLLLWRYHLPVCRHQRFLRHADHPWGCQLWVHFRWTIHHGEGPFFVFDFSTELQFLFITLLMKTVWSASAFDLGRNMAVSLVVRVCGCRYGKGSDGEQKHRKTYVFDLPPPPIGFTNDTVEVMIVSACLFILGYAMTWARK